MITALIVGTALAQPLAQPSDADICRVFTQLTAQANPTLPRLLDPFTRVDSIDLSCTGRTLIFNKTLLLTESGMQPGWRATMQAEFNRTMCAEPRFRLVVRQGWQVGHVFTLQDGSRVEQVISC